MMDQEVKYISIKELILWTENPRDPIDENAKDQDIVNKALEDSSNKWTLTKLAKEMGSYYDFSELPTVVYHDKKPVVYDGNRRIILGKIKYGLVTSPNKINIPEFPEEIPCNVCSEKTALQNVLRKHGDTGSWLPLERDIFLHKFMGESKSSFLILEEETGIISANPSLNQRFVKEEILKDEILKSMGFSIKDDKLYSVHNDEDGYNILIDISQKIEQKEISTRKNRGKVIDILEPSSRRLIDQNKQNKLQPSSIDFSESKNSENNKRQSRRTLNRQTSLFGGILYLRKGEVNNLYRDIVDLHQFYTQSKNKLSPTFPSLIRMSLRLLCETAAKDYGAKRIDDYLKNNFPSAKKSLNSNITTTLANQNVTEQSIVQLLQTGAHSYESSSNLEQTIALSIIIGAMLSITHGETI